MPWRTSGAYALQSLRAQSTLGGSRARQPLRLAPSLLRLSPHRRDRVVGRLEPEVHGRDLPRVRLALPHRVSRLHRAAAARGRPRPGDPAPDRLTPDLSPLGPALESAPLETVPVRLLISGIVLARVPDAWSKRAGGHRRVAARARAAARDRPRVRAGRARRAGDASARVRLAVCLAAPPARHDRAADAGPRRGAPGAA